MRAPKPEWVRALRALDGMAESDLRFNEVVGRWEFRIPLVTGQLASQFYCWEHDPKTGEKFLPDPVTGLLPFRELDDAGMRQVLTNLDRTYILNPHDGAGTATEDVRRREAHNRNVWKSKHREAAQAFGDMALDRLTRLRGSLSVASAGIEVATVIGSPK